VDRAEKINGAVLRNNSPEATLSRSLGRSLTRDLKGANEKKQE
jgi:hypothetical protein